MSHSLHHTDAADTAKLLQELDRDSKSRSLTGGYKTAMTVLFVLYSLTMIVMALVVSGATQYTRLPVFVGMTLFVGYLKYPASKRDALRDNYFPWYDIVLAFASLGVFFYYAIEQKRIIQMANRIGTTQIIIGIIGILLLVELCRRSTGIPLIVVVGLFTVYGAWWLTNNNPKTALRNLIYNLFYNLNCGIFSSPITVCASFIVLLPGENRHRHLLRGSGKLHRRRQRGRPRQGRRYLQRLGGNVFRLLRRQYRRQRQHHHPHHEKGGL